jgi:hypothetical protein
MTSEVEICNRALDKVGTRSTIASLTEASNEAKICNLIVSAPTRDETLGNGVLELRAEDGESFAA